MKQFSIFKQTQILDCHTALAMTHAKYRPGFQIKSGMTPEIQKATAAGGRFYNFKYLNV